MIINRTRGGGGIFWHQTWNSNPWPDWGENKGFGGVAIAPWPSLETTSALLYCYYIFLFEVNNMSIHQALILFSPQPTASEAWPV